MENQNKNCQNCKTEFEITSEDIEFYNKISGVTSVPVFIDDNLANIAAAEAARCANQQGKFWEYHDQLFEQQDNLGASLYTALAQSLKLDMDKFNSCLNGHLTLAKVKKDYEDGLAAGVIGTPTFFVNGYPLSGALPLAVWDQIITAALKDKFKK